MHNICPLSLPLLGRPVLNPAVEKLHFPNMCAYGMLGTQRKTGAGTINGWSGPWAELAVKPRLRRNRTHFLFSFGTTFWFCCIVDALMAWECPNQCT